MNFKKKLLSTIHVLSFVLDSEQNRIEDRLSNSCSGDRHYTVYVDGDGF